MLSRLSAHGRLEFIECGHLYEDLGNPLNHSIFKIEGGTYMYMEIGAYLGIYGTHNLPQWCTCIYRILSSKRPWALVIDGQKTGAGAYTDKPCITVYTSTSKNGWRLYGDGRLLERIRYYDTIALIDTQVHIVVPEPSFRAQLKSSMQSSGCPCSLSGTGSRFLGPPVFG